MVLIAAGVILLTYYKTVAHLDGLARNRFIIDKAKIDADSNAAKTEVVQTDSDKAALQIALNTANEAKQSRDQIVALLNKTLETQRQKDSSLTPSDLSLRWANLIEVQPTDIKATAGGIVVSLQAGHKTVNLIEEVFTLRETNKRDQIVLMQQDGLIGGFQKVVIDREAELNTCKITLVDQEKKHKDEISVINTKNRKKGFWYGLGGFIGGLILSKRLGV